MAEPRAPVVVSPVPSGVLWVLDLFRANGDLFLAGAVFGILAILMVPLPPMVLDVLLAVSITSSLLIFLVSLYATTPVDFSVFPTVTKGSRARSSLSPSASFSRAT